MDVSRKLRLKQPAAESTCAADSVRSISSPGIFTPSAELQTLGVCAYQVDNEWQLDISIFGIKHRTLHICLYLLQTCVKYFANVL